jgi:hypothetical protein
MTAVGRKDSGGHRHRRRLAEGVLVGEHEGVRIIPVGQRRGSLVPEDPGGAAVGGQRLSQIGE